MRLFEQELNPFLWCECLLQRWVAMRACWAHMYHSLSLACHNMLWPTRNTYDHTLACVCLVVLLPQPLKISDPTRITDGGTREGGYSAKLWRAQAHPPRASEPAPRVPGCLCITVEFLGSQLLLLQVDILCRALNKEQEGHIMCAFPTGYGKSLPMLLLGLFMPKGIWSK